MFNFRVLKKRGPADDEVEQCICVITSYTHYVSCRIQRRKVSLRYRSANRLTTDAISINPIVI